MVILEIYYTHTHFLINDYIFAVEFIFPIFGPVKIMN